jgi:hypothetical protein
LETREEPERFQTKEKEAKNGETLHAEALWLKRASDEGKRVIGPKG